MRVIHVPMSEMLWPPKKRRKLRWRKRPPGVRVIAGWPGSGRFSRNGSLGSVVMRLWFRCSARCANGAVLFCRGELD